MTGRGETGDEGPHYDRRRFLMRVLGGATALAPVGVGALWLTRRRPWRAESGTKRPGSVVEGLPPRVVALRSLGGDFRFDPPGLLVEPGAEVTWLNMGDFHTTTAFHPANDALLPGGVPLRIPEDAESWHSGVLGLTAGTEFTHRFVAPGVYDYFCQPHYGFGMVGRIIVDGPRGGPAITRPIDELVEAARLRMPTVAEIMEPRGATFEWAARINGVLRARANGADSAAPARSVATSLLQDRDLRDLMDGGALRELERAVEGFSRSVERGDDYEALVRAADAIKASLREAHAG